MKRRFVLFLTIAALTCTASAPLSAQSIKGKELLGLRVGGDISPSTLDPVFGRGSTLEVHFLHGFTSWCGVDVSLSSHDFGPSNDIFKNIEFTGSDREVDLQIYSFSAGFLCLTAVKKRILPTVEAGPGLYSINAVLPSGLFEAQKNEFRVGLYGGVGAIVRMTRGFSLNVNAKYHYIFSGNDRWDTIRFYTGKERTEMYEFTIGLLIMTG